MLGLAFVGELGIGRIERWIAYPVLLWLALERCDTLVPTRPLGPGVGAPGRLRGSALGPISQESESSILTQVLVLLIAGEPRAIFLAMGGGGWDGHGGDLAGARGGLRTMVAREQSSYPQADRITPREFYVT